MTENDDQAILPDCCAPGRATFLGQAQVTPAATSASAEPCETAPEMSSAE